MALQRIEHRNLLRRHIIDGAGNLPLAVKGVQTAAVGGIVHGIPVNIVEIHGPGALLPHYDHAVLGQIFVRILGDEIRIEHRIPGLHGNVLGKPLVPLQKLQKRGILASLLGDQIERHILIQRLQDLRRLLSRGEKLLLAHVIFQVLGGQVRRDQIDEDHGRAGDGRHARPVAPMLFVQELHGEKQEQQHHRHIIYHPGQVKDSLDEIDEGLIDADRRQNVCQNPLCPDHVCDARGHIQEKEHAEGQHRRDHLAFCQGRQEKPDGQAGRAKQSVAEDRSVGHGKGYTSKLQQNQRIQAQRQHRDQKYRQHGQVFSRHDLPDGDGGCQQQLIRLLLFLLRHAAHGQHRHHDEQHEIDGGQDDPKDRIAAHQAVRRIVQAGHRQKHRHENVARHRSQIASQLSFINRPHLLFPPFLLEPFPLPAFSLPAFPSLSLPLRPFPVPTR